MDSYLGKTLCIKVFKKVLLFVLDILPKTVFNIIIDNKIIETCDIKHLEKFWGINFLEIKGTYNTNTIQ